MAQLSREPDNHDRHGDGKEIFAGCQSVPLASNLADTTGSVQTETKNFRMAVLLTAKPQKHARYESIHKAAQYKNSGAIQIGIMNESEVITVGVKEDFQCLRRAAHRKGMRAKLHYLTNAEESEAAARRYCDDSTARFRF